MKLFFSKIQKDLEESIDKHNFTTENDYTIIVKKLNKSYSQQRIKEMFSVPGQLEVVKVNMVYDIADFFREVKKYIRQGGRFSRSTRYLLEYFYNKSERIPLKD